MKIIRSAENAFGTSVRYEHDGKVFTVRGASVTEIRERIPDELAEENLCRNVPEREPELSGEEEEED